MLALLLVDDEFVVKPLEQRLLWRMRWYVMNELYGTTALLPAEQPSGADDDASTQRSGATPECNDAADADESSSFDDDAAHCVVCLSAPRTVAVLPCRHMSLCAGTLR
jgi:hypothetical protein